MDVQKSGRIIVALWLLCSGVVSVLLTLNVLHRI